MRTFNCHYIIKSSFIHQIVQFEWDLPWAVYHIWKMMIVLKLIKCTHWLVGALAEALMQSYTPLTEGSSQCLITTRIKVICSAQRVEEMTPLSSFSKDGENGWKGVATIAPQVIPFLRHPQHPLSNYRGVKLWLSYLKWTISIINLLNNLRKLKVLTRNMNLGQP